MFALVTSALERQKEANPWTSWTPSLAHLMSSRQWETLSRQCLKNDSQGCSLVSTHTGTQVPMYTQRHAHTYKNERGLIRIFGLDVLALREKCVFEIVHNDTCNDAHSFVCAFYKF